MAPPAVENGRLRDARLAHATRRARLMGTLAVAFGVACGGATAAPPATGLHTEVVFSDYSPLSANPELLRRMLSPLALVQVQDSLGRSAGQLVQQSIDLSAERFVLYVPAAARPEGYGLLVFVPPWHDARLPDGWGPALDRAGIIYVSAGRSGNDENVLARRAPLALLGAYNVMQRYPVDPARVYVSGLSGGSHVAERLALAFPDLFRGALLNAGSDPLGSQAPPQPPAELFRRFQESTRLVYVTGERDSRLSMDAASQQSMQRWCVFDTDTQTTAAAAHQIASPEALSRALEALQVHHTPDAAKLARCRADIERSLAAALQKAQALIDAGKRTQAQQAVIEIDRRFGGLAAPRSVEMQSALSRTTGTG